MTTAVESLPVSTPVPHASEDAASLDLVPALCAICGLEDAEPVAVGTDFEYRKSIDEFLAVRCRRCSLVYLNPRPAEHELSRIYPDDYHAFEFKPRSYGLIYRVRGWLEARRLLRWCRDLPEDARILDVGCGDGFHLALLRKYGAKSWTLEGLDSDARAVNAAKNNGFQIHHGQVDDDELPAGAYHLVLLIMTIEHLPDPLGTLQSAARLVAPGGKVVIVTDNAVSPDFAIFGGRHWGGYHFPRHFYLFSKKTLSLLASRAGLQVQSVKTAMSPVNWVYSMRNWLDDWGAPRWIVGCFSLKSAPALALFTLIDMPLSWIGRGAILHGILRKPAMPVPETGIDEQP